MKGQGLRVAQLFGGLVLFGVSDALLLRPALGADPWDVFHQGLSRTFGLGVGTWALIVGGAVLLGWVPLRQRPGVGTVCNALVVGPVINVSLELCPVPHGLALRVGVLLAGILLNAVATGAYIGAGLGPGPRDGLTIGLARRGRSIRLVRTGIELTVLAAGWALGGTVGVGTVAYALLIGPLVHHTIPALARRPGSGQQAAEEQLEGLLAAPPERVGCAEPGGDGARE